MKKNLLRKNDLWMYLLGLVLLVSGAWQSWWVYGLVGAILFLGIIFNKEEEVSEGLMWYLSVMLLMGVTIFWSENRLAVFQNFSLFLLGGGWMYLGSGIKVGKSFNKKLAWIIAVLGLSWLMIFLWNEFFVEGMRIGSRGLVLWGTHTKDHHHLGDWWALVVLSQFWLLKSNKKTKYRNFNLLLILVGIVWIYFSRSRSAILSVIGGVVFLFGNKLWKEKAVRWVLGFSILAFVVLGMTKPIFINRQYWLQGIVGWWRYPFGLGVGNFGDLSLDAKNHVLGLNGYSSVAHNVFLEFLAGMGILGLFFWWWGIKYVIEPFVTKKIKPSLIGGLLLALGINFMFDMTYLVAPMWWTFMFLLGFLEKEFEF